MTEEEKAAEAKRVAEKHAAETPEEAEERRRRSREKRKRKAQKKWQKMHTPPKLHSKIPAREVKFDNTVTAGDMKLLGASLVEGKYPITVADRERMIAFCRKGLKSERQGIRLQAAALLHKLNEHNVKVDVFNTKMTMKMMQGRFGGHRDDSQPTSGPPAAVQVNVNVEGSNAPRIAVEQFRTLDNDAKRRLLEAELAEENGAGAGTPAKDAGADRVEGPATPSAGDVQDGYAVLAGELGLDVRPSAS